MIAVSRRALAWTVQGDAAGLAPKAGPLSASRKLKEVEGSGDEAERISGRNWAVSASWSSQAAPQRLQADLSSW